MAPRRIDSNELSIDSAVSLEQAPPGEQNMRRNCEALNRASGRLGCPYNDNMYFTLLEACRRAYHAEALAQCYPIAAP